MSEGPRLRLITDPNGPTVLLFDRMPHFEPGSPTEVDWLTAVSRVGAVNYLPLRFEFEIKLERW